MTYGDEVRDRLTGWLCTQLPAADGLRVEGLDRVEFGHSAEMMVLTIVSGRGSRRRPPRCRGPTAAEAAGVARTL